MWAVNLWAVGYWVHWAHWLLSVLAVLLSMLSVGITLRTDFKKPKRTYLTLRDTSKLRQAIGLVPDDDLGYESLKHAKAYRSRL
jgi:hypothetical protein